MKRSEMVNKMVGHFRGAQNLGNEKAIFSYILDKMEDVGMKPPFCEKLYNPHTDFNTGNEWESEDEEK